MIVYPYGVVAQCFAPKCDIFDGLKLFSWSAVCQFAEPTLRNEDAELDHEASRSSICCVDKRFAQAPLTLTRPSAGETENVKVEIVFFCFLHLPLVDRDRCLKLK